jgi:carbonic anhydrase
VNYYWVIILDSKKVIQYLLGERTSLAHGTLVHGPAYIGDDTFVGMESLVFNAKLGNNVAIGVSSTITDG